jgi:uncharacterized protein YjiS (DUF1127 family)
MSGFTDRMLTNFHVLPRDTTARPRHTRVTERVGSLFRLWRRRVRERRALAELTERDLRDLCLTRVDVMNELSKPFWRD